MSNLVDKLPGAGMMNKIFTGCFIASAAGFGRAAYNSNTAAEKIIYGALAVGSALVAIGPIVLDLGSAYRANRKS